MTNLRETQEKRKRNLRETYDIGKAFKKILHYKCKPKEALRRKIKLPVAQLVCHSDMLGGFDSF